MTAALPDLLTADRLALLRQRLAQAGISSTGDTTTAPTPADVPAPTGTLGIAERRMWKIYDLDPDSLSHNISLILGFGVGYTLDTVVAAAELMIRNSPVLSSTVSVIDGEPRREPAEVTGRWVRAGAVWQAGQIPEGGQLTGDMSSDIAHTAELFTHQPFDLSDAAPFRMRILDGPDGVTVVLVVHHLAVDDTSWPFLLGTLTTGAVPGTLPGDGVDPAAPATAGTLAAAVDHARATWAADDVRFPLSGELPATTPEESWLAPLCDRPGRQLTADLEAEQVRALNRVADEVGATSNALFLALTALSVYATTGAADHVLLIPADNRPAGASPASVGYCGNIIPIRFTLDPRADVRSALRTAVTSIYRAMEFSSVDYGAILTALRASGGRFPVVEVLASVRNAPLRGIPVPDGRHITYESRSTGIANYPLAYAFEIAADDHIHLELDHQPDIVDDDAARHAVHTTTALVQRLPAALDRTLGEFIVELSATH